MKALEAIQEPDIEIRVAVTELGGRLADGTCQCAVMVSPEGNKKPSKKQAVLALMLALDSLHSDLSDKEWVDCAEILKASRESREHAQPV